MRKNKKSQLPLLPPEVGEDEIEVSDEDVNFVQKNKRFAGFLTSLDTNSITKQVVRLSDDQNGDALESYYEKRLKKNSSLGEGDNSDSKDSGRVQQIVEGMRNEPKLDEDVGTGQTKEKLTKAERRKELKQVKRQAKKQAKEQSQNDKLSKAPKSAVLKYLQKLIALGRDSSFHQIAVRCMCGLVEAIPHFNYRDSLLAAVILHMSSTDDLSRKLSCAAVRSIFLDEGKHGGEATLQAAQLIADFVKLHRCHLHPDTIERYQPEASDPELSGALSSVLWELALLSKHYHPATSELASNIASMSSSHNQVFLSTISPTDALRTYSTKEGAFRPPIQPAKLNRKRKANHMNTYLVNSSEEAVQEKDAVRMKFTTHFKVLRDIKDNERLRRELNTTLASLRLYDQYKARESKKMRTGTAL